MAYLRRLMQVVPTLEAERAFVMLDCVVRDDLAFVALFDEHPLNRNIQNLYNIY